MKDQTEVSPLSGEGNPLSAPLQRSIRLLRLPLPALLSAFLAGCFPSSGGVQAYHVPLVCPDGLGPTCSPVMLVVSERGNWIPLYPSRTFWFKPVSTFGLFALTTFISSSLPLAIPSNSSASTALMLAVIAFPRGCATPFGEATLSRKLPTPGLLRAQVSVEYRWENTRLSPVIQSQQPHKRLHVATSYRRDGRLRRLCGNTLPVLLSG